MDSFCQFINKTINIDADREKYTNMYDTVRNAIINGLKEDNNFKLLFSDLKLCGSYADNLKVSKPDEFDLVMCLQFPHNKLVDISADNENRGNVFIDISKVLVSLETEKRDNARKFLKGMVNSKKYFLEDKFQSWLQGCFARLMTKLMNQLRHTDGSILHLSYSRHGPAHTIDVTNNPHKFAIDFVPGFVFEASKKICKREVKTQYWQAIPKPMGVKENKSFRTSYTDSERLLFENKNQFKAILRMMKKFRDNKPKMVNLKSYYIKTLFLWHDENSNPRFWNKPSIELVQEMFSVLYTALSTQMIPFFWNKKLNLLASMSLAQIESMRNEVAAARRILMQPRGKFVSIFLTAAEQKQYNEYEESEGTDMDQLCQKISRVISMDTQRDTRVCSQMDFVKNKFISQLKEIKDFSLLFWNTKASNSENLNVSKRKKLTVVVCLQLPHNKDVTITRDNVIPGNVFINISNVIDRLERDKKEDASKFLQRLVNLKKYLLQDKLNSWFEGCMDTVLRKLNRQLVYGDGSTLHLSSRKCGPAYTIEVGNFSHKFFIDFMPGLLFEASKKVCTRNLTSEHWLAVAKPMGVRDNMSFKPSYDECVNKNQFKNALRIMKKFRDNKPKMVNLKSYYIKTLFLWHNEQCASDFWSKPTIEILHVMFTSLKNALEKGEIPWFWERRLNLLSELGRNQIDSMYAEVRNAMRVMIHPASPPQFLAIFLNQEEISRVTIVSDIARGVPSVDQEVQRPVVAQNRQAIVHSPVASAESNQNAIVILGIAVAATCAAYKYFTSRRDHN